MTRTHFAFRIDMWTPSGESIVTESPFSCFTQAGCIPNLFPANLRLHHGGRRLLEHLAMAGRNLWLLGIWLEQNALKKIPFHDRYKEFTDELTNAHVPELCLER